VGYHGTERRHPPDLEHRLEELEQKLDKLEGQIDSLIGLWNQSLGVFKFLKLMFYITAPFIAAVMWVREHVKL
jgi:hypothetical protein